MAIARGSSRRLRAGALGAGTSILGATLLGLFAPRAAWLLVNALVWGIPFWIALVVGREFFRIAVARAFGFRLFALRWGLGPVRLRGRLGRTAYGISPAPFAIESHLASSRPRHHRAARWIFQLAPLLGQAALAAALLPAVEVSHMQMGFAPIESLAATNFVLLALHGLVCLDTRWGLRTDFSRLISLLLASADEDRAARADVWVIAIEDALEVGDHAGARNRLGRALASLGRETDLVVLEDRLDRIEAAPDPSAAARAEVRRDALLRTDPNATRSPAPAARRALAMTLGLAPTFALGFAGLMSLRAPLAEALATRWSSQALEVASEADAAACEVALSRFEGRMRRIDGWTKADPQRSILEGYGLAELRACSGDLELAILHQSEALAETDALRAEANAGGARIDDPVGEIDAVARHAMALRRLSGWQAARSAYREALQSLGRAGQEVMLAENRIAAWPESPNRLEVQQRLALEEAEILLEKTRIFRLMGAEDRARESYDDLLSSWNPSPNADPDFAARLLAAAPN